MRFSIEVLFAVASVLPAVSAGGFHLFDRSMSFQWTECVDCPRKQQCCGTYGGTYQDLMLIPSNQYNCDAIRNRGFKLNKEGSWQIGHGTWVPGKCGSNGIVFYPVNNGNELEVWESGGSKMYGKCYRQSGGKQLNCDDQGGAACRGIEGEPKNGCKIKATDVWVCPVSLC
ncbi:hypothetical protein ABW19_dt0209553 [Dactylella cylindrospora]|nr:hypothetical protein ABW19_dt0209553 [Dactylella cylindrospora]